MPPLRPLAHPLGPYFEAAKQHILASTKRYLLAVSGAPASIDTVLDRIIEDDLVGSGVGQITKGAAYHIAHLMTTERTTPSEPTATQQKSTDEAPQKAPPANSKNANGHTIAPKKSKREHKTERNRRRNEKKKMKRTAAKYGKRQGGDSEGRANEFKDETRGEEERASTGCMTDGENSSSMTTRRPRLSIGSADNVKEASEEERADWDGFSNEWNGFSDDVDDERKGPLETTLRPSSPAPPLARLSPAAMR